MKVVTTTTTTVTQMLLFIVAVLQVGFAAGGGGDANVCVRLAPSWKLLLSRQTKVGTFRV